MKVKNDSFNKKKKTVPIPNGNLVCVEMTESL